MFLQLTMVSRKVLLTSRWGYYLQIDEQQNICGARTKDDYCVLEMNTVDFSKVTIRGENTNVYIAMNAQGNLFTTDTENPSCVWKEIHQSDGYNYYESDQHGGFFLALKRKGVPKNGNRTALGQISSAFLAQSVQ